jgi:hypothetical protein
MVLRSAGICWLDIVCSPNRPVAGRLGGCRQRRSTAFNSVLLAEELLAGPMSLAAVGPLDGADLPID